MCNFDLSLDFSAKKAKEAGLFFNKTNYLYRHLKEIIWRYANNGRLSINYDFNKYFHEIKKDVDFDLLCQQTITLLQEEGFEVNIINKSKEYITFYISWETA